MTKTEKPTQEMALSTPENETNNKADEQLNVTNNIKKENDMSETKTASVQTTVTENQYSSSTNGKLSQEQIELCEKAVQDLVDQLESNGLAGTVMGKSIINITGAHKTGKINVARLKMNRKPKNKAVRALQEAMMLSGQQIMLLVIPAKVAKNLGFEIESFDGTEIREDELSMTVVIIDGQTRMKAYLEAIKEDPNSQISNLYAYFPLNWVNMNDMLTSINLKVFTWKNSDFMTMTLCNDSIEYETRATLKRIQGLESEGYNYTAACEWITLDKGIVRKTPLVKATSVCESSLKFDKAEYGIQLCDAAQKKFEGEFETVLKSKIFPELVISKWNGACKELTQPQATELMKTFFGNLTKKEIEEIAKPSEYKRGCGRKREEFVAEHFEASFNTFLSKHPYSTFKKV